MTVEWRLNSHPFSREYTSHDRAYQQGNKTMLERENSFAPSVHLPGDHPMNRRHLLAAGQVATALMLRFEDEE
jgi:hypothetical protein